MYVQLYVQLLDFMEKTIRTIKKCLNWEKMWSHGTKKKSLSQKCRKETSKCYTRGREASKEAIAALQTEKWMESGDISRERQHMSFLHSFKITLPKVNLLCQWLFSTTNIILKLFCLGFKTCYHPFHLHLSTGWPPLEVISYPPTDLQGRDSYLPASAHHHA